MGSLSLKGLALSKMSLPATSGIFGSSFESVESTLSDTVMTGNIESLVDIAKQVDKQCGVVDQAIAVTGGLSDLVDRTMEVYSENGITERGAQLLRLSVESLLTANGINVPAELIVHSFESKTTLHQYSAEVIDRKNNVLTKILSWLYTALKSIADALKLYWTRLTASANGLRNYIQKVKGHVAKLEGEAKNPETLINLGTSSIWLTNRSKQLSTPAKQIVNTVARFEDFVHEWRDLWGPFTTVQIPGQNVTTTEVTKTSDQIRDLALSAAKHSSKANINFVVTHALVLKQGSGEMPLLGASCKIEQIVAADNHLAAVLSLNEMRDGITDAEDALRVLSNLQAEINKFDKITQHVQQLSKNITVKDDEGIPAEELRNAMRTLSKACSLSSWGWTNTTPYFLKTIKACVSYIDACTHRYGVKG